MYISTQKNAVRLIGQAEGDDRSILFLTPSSGSSQPIQRLRSAGWHVISCNPGQESMEGIELCQIGIVHFQKFNAEFITFLQHMFGRYPDIRWIALVDKPQLENARIKSLISENFHDFHTMPIDLDRLNVILGHAHGFNRLVHEARKKDPLQVIDDYGIVGVSRQIEHLRNMISKAATTDSPVLILGESGTGKELVASAIHAQSAKRDGPFIAVNCASLPATLIQAELFGYEKGAFTGADSRKIGLIESAAGGTLFLDEIGDLSASLQVNLLRFLQEKRITRVGGHEEIPVNVRVIAATNLDLESEIESEAFRKDLYYRLNVIQVRTTPLRERREDIEYLARHFLEKFRNERKKAKIGFSAEALMAIHQYDWPGNVRELSNKILRAMIIAEGKAITAADLDLAGTRASQVITSLDEVRSEAEAKAIVKVIIFTKKNMSETARLLGVTRATLYRLIAKHNILASAQKDDIEASLATREG